MSDNSITLSIFPQAERFSFLPKLFGNGAYMEGEALVYKYMSAICDEYTGAYWKYASLSNGGYVMLPEMEEKSLKIQIRLNMYEGTMTPEAAGIVCCLYALSGMSFHYLERDPAISQHIAERYHQLRDYAVSHPEWAAIGAAID